MVEILFKNLVPCIPLERSEYCGQSAFVYALTAIRVSGVESQEKLRRFVADKTWGTQPHEHENMASAYLPASHFFAKTNWRMEELEEILENQNAVAIININDDFIRIAKEGRISTEPPDGHYINVWTFIEIDNKKYAVVIDGSTEKIMEGHNGVLHTKYDGVYLIAKEYFESIWHDKLKNGEDNYHWAMVLVSLDTDPSILEKYRIQGKIA